ncbi:alpha/beta hydrolase [Amycolatopsis sp. YIM 10]|uniref:alpha/beta hydrolase n=1 Tax=Amycolatopsis sp. YIM 10 TaxID=2653857 RepID=UPI00128FDCFB|nr:alpha/beta hydrolase [Amycolatopsis sp. YIM 10]QFU93201.1 fermentation/respiration switch protein [Amycolatopsis sp. YIM 10]
MNDVEELKQFALVHARTQGVPPELTDAVLGRITTDDAGTPGSWTGEWSRAAEESEARQQLADASRLYTMARFPFVDGPARQHALDKAVDTFTRSGSGLEPFQVDTPAGVIRCWRGGSGPLVLVSGGIVSIKEQWAGLLGQLIGAGLSGVVTELPRTGGNSLPYDAESWRMIPAILDALGATSAYAMMMSFSGHLALRCAARDSRIKGILTVGAPVSGFFTDAAWQQTLPRVTVDTIVHLTGEKPGGLADWALSADELGAIDVPVAYVASKRDEIIPPQDIELLTAHVRRFSLLEHDDVHGSPAHTAQTGAWLTQSLQAMTAK